MRISTLGRHFREGFRSIWRNGWMSFASISAISISLFILGVFMIVAMNVNQLTKDIESEVEIRVYLDTTVQRSEVPQLQNDIAKIKIGGKDVIKKIDFVSKEDGLEFLKERLGDDGRELLEGQEGDNNPLPDSFTVEVYDPRMIEAVAQSILTLNEGKDPAPIWEVNYGADTVRTLFKVTDIVRNVGLILVGGLALMSMFLIANTIKITIVARRREISIMKLVGATNSFIRWPFFVEGALLGIIGSAIPLIILYVLYHQLISLTKMELGLLQIALLPLSEIASVTAVLLLGIGFVIGVWGSLLSVRKFLKV
ncbi:permease-like cell division protein FtsX [Paenibacillus thermotolerans]|uniref:permease-like cell division protein FtsX n=1 Tax=Paenibacillus thermotolerans TaxID=3027807 RepID=UPI002367EE7C|nr:MULTISPECIES: permease-like cell division protein FtsX [unclassified Paenibacillus]